jgi:hypothetical protein
MLIVTNKFFKNKLLISEVNTWNARNWALKLLRYLQLCNWDIFRIIISDRDVKFRFELWKWIFRTLKINLLTSTTYHSQTDDQSERTNQTIEIALRYFLTSNSNDSWHETLSFLQHSYMNIMISTEYSSNQMLYELNTNWKLFMLAKTNTNSAQEASEKNSKLSRFRDIVRMNVINVIDFVNVRSKVIYDRSHKAIAFNEEDKVYLRLHREYFLLEKENTKLSQQRSDSYVIKRKIERAAYELKLSKNARIHSIISIAQLKSTEKDSNLYDRFRSINSEFVEMKENTSIKRSYEMKRILKKRSKKYEKIVVRQYLIKWKDWRSKHNTWKSEKDCENVKNLIAKFHNRQKKSNQM